MKNSTINSIVNFIESIKDDRKSIDYYVCISNTLSIQYDNIVILNDFAGYPDLRIKTFRNFSYKCDRKIVYDTCNTNKNHLKILSLSSSGVKNADERLINLAKFYFDVILITNNIGQDFGGYYSALHFIKDKKLCSKTVTFMNTSQYYSGSHIASLIDFKIPPKSYLGISFGIGPRFKLTKYFHIQSYFMKFHLHDAYNVFEKLILDGKFYSAKYNIIEFGEVELSKICIKLNISPTLAYNNKLIKINPINSIFHYDFREQIFRLNKNSLTLI